MVEGVVCTLSWFYESEGWGVGFLEGLGVGGEGEGLLWYFEWMGCRLAGYGLS